jgi:hypothetical protein
MNARFQAKDVHGRRKACMMLAVLSICAGTLALLFTSLLEARTAGTVSGVVFDRQGAVANARVRVQGTGKVALTDGAGRFVLTGAPVERDFNVSAWKEGYYSALLKDVKAPKEGIRLNLVRYQINDNPHYKWIPPEGARGSCAECHPAITEMSLGDAHMKAAVNPRFLTMYYGTDMEGNRSPLTAYGKGKAYSPWGNTSVPQPLDSKKAYYGPGFQLDFPGAAGECSACHIPGASLRGNVDPGTVQGTDRYGVHCDFCHKVGNVRLSPVSRMPFAKVPGVHAMTVKRPFADDRERSQLFFGTFEDVNASEGDTNLPLFRESRYCAACHFGVFWDTVVYNSYGEWLKSPYADPNSGKAKTCQECHMPSPTIYKGKALTNVAPGKGGIERDPSAIHNHNMTVDAELLRNSLTMEASARIQNGRVVVDVTLVNDRTGHHIPTDTPLRHLILLVEARDSRGTALRQLSGPQLPDWCGRGDVKKGHYAGHPGKAYAKLLKEKWTDVFPTGAYWNHTELVSDNRLAAFATDRTKFAFAGTERGNAIVSVKLLYRRAFIKLMEQKKWNAPDIVMAEKQILLTGG